MFTEVFVRDSHGEPRRSVARSLAAIALSTFRLPHAREEDNRALTARRTLRCRTSCQPSGYTAQIRQEETSAVVSPAGAANRHRGTARAESAAYSRTYRESQGGYH